MGNGKLVWSNFRDAGVRINVAGLVRELHKKAEAVGFIAMPPELHDHFLFILKPLDRRLIVTFQGVDWIAACYQDTMNRVGCDVRVAIFGRSYHFRSGIAFLVVDDKWYPLHCLKQFRKKCVDEVEDQVES